VRGRFLGPCDGRPAREHEPQQADRPAERRKRDMVEERGADRIGEQARLGNREAGGGQAECDADGEMDAGRPGEPEETGIEGLQASAPVSSGGIWFTPIRRRNTQ
jgi:hypothetical protein